MAGTPITLIALVAVIVIAIKVGWKAVSAPIPPPPIVPCVNQDVHGTLSTSDVTVSVLNSGHTRGLASNISRQLANVGFTTGTVTNTKDTVKKVTIIGHSTTDPEVKLVAGFFPDAALKADPRRVDHQVQVVLGDRSPTVKGDAPKSIAVKGPVCLPSPVAMPEETPGESPS